MHNLNEQRPAIEAEVMLGLLSQPQDVWEALGPDGITYPDFNTNTLRIDPDKRKGIEKRMAAVDDSTALHLAHLLVFKDYEAIGRLMVRQVDNYLQEAIEQGIEEFEIDLAQINFDDRGNEP